MVSELWLNATQDVAILWGISPTNAVYLYALLFSVFFAIVIGVKSGKPIAGLIGFLGSLLMFSLLDAFPLWIIALPLTIIIVIGYYARGKE